MAAELEPAIEKVAEQIGKLTLVAPRDGQVMGVPHPETVGQWLKPGKPFCEVGDPHQLEAHMILDQSRHRPDPARPEGLGEDLRRLREVTHESKVSEIAKRNREEIPPELSNLAGGEIATKQDPKTGRAKPLTAVYEVDHPDRQLRTSSSSPACAGSPRSTAAPTRSAGGSGG